MKKLSRLLGTVLLLLSCSTVAMAAPFLFNLPDPEDGGSRYAFTWQGELDFADGSPFEKFDNQKFTLSGFCFSNGTFEITQLELLDPYTGGGGNLVALPNPDMGNRPGSLFLPPPEIGGPGCIIILKSLLLNLVVPH